MIVAYVLDYIPEISFQREGMGLRTPLHSINRSWQLQEAVGLSDYCRVELIPAGMNPPPVKPDIVYAACDSVAVHAFRLAKLYDVPFVAQVISRLPDYEDEAWKRTLEALRHANALTGVSPVVYRSLREFGNENGIEVHLIPHGANDRIADKVADSRRRQFIAISALMKHKRIDMLLEAFCRLNKDNLVIIGDGPERTELEILNHIWGDPARFIGATDDWEKFTELKASKALLSASKGEQFFIPAAEALYCRTPAILYDLENIREVYSGANGAISYFKTMDELMDLIERFDSMDEEKLMKMGEKGRRYVEEKGLTLSVRSKNLYEVLKGVREWIS